MGLVKKVKKKRTSKKTKPTVKKSVSKPRKRRVPAKKAKVPTSKIYETRIDEILKIIQTNEKITFEELSKEIDLPINQIESWIKILQKHKLIHVHYPVMGKPYATKTSHTRIPELEIKDNKTRNLVIFAVICFIILIAGYYLSFTQWKKSDT